MKVGTRSAMVATVEEGVTEKGEKIWGTPGGMGGNLGTVDGWRLGEQEVGTRSGMMAVERLTTLTMGQT